MTDSASSSNPSNTAGTTGNSRTYPTDPFERDFRSPAANMSAEEILKFMEPDFQDLTEDDIRTLQSKEWAERMRPWCQWHTILKERDLAQQYSEIFCQEPNDPESRYNRLHQFLETEAPDLLSKFQHYEARRDTHPVDKEKIALNHRNVRI